MSILAIQNRIALLQSRKGKENEKIIRKLQRKLRHLEDNTTK